MNPSEFDFSKASLIVKTLRDYEGVVAQTLKKTFQDIEVLAKPLNFSGLVLVKADAPAEEIARETKMHVPEAKKMTPSKFEVKEYFKRASLVQMPYLGGLEVSYEMGVRIGREAQIFEVVNSLSCQ